MLLALDAGNSNITIGAFEGKRLLSQWRLRTVHEQTADEWGILLRNLFVPAGLDIGNVDGIIEGTTAGLDASGFLIVRKDDGTDTLIVAGGVRAAGS